MLCHIKVGRALLENVLDGLLNGGSGVLHEEIQRRHFRDLVGRIPRNSLQVEVPPEEFPVPIEKTERAREAGYRQIQKGALFRWPFFALPALAQIAVN